MAYTFPLAIGEFAGLLPVSSFRWVLERFEETSGTAFGDILTSEIAAPKWRAEVGLRPMPVTEANDLQAMFEVLGSSNTFDLYDLRKCFPASDPGGDAIAGHVLTIHAVGTSALRLAGLPNGYRLTRGDMVTVLYGPAPQRRALYRIAEDAIAQPSGITPWFEVRPHIKTGTVAGDVASVWRPAARMQVTSYDPGDRAGRYVGGMGFTAIEAR